jgi:hypothetical protein
MTAKDRIYTGILALLSFLAFLPQYTSSKIIAWLDMPFYFYPFRDMPAELLRHGVLPLWNPFLYCGQPLLANMQSAVLYPPDMLYYVMPVDIAFKVSTFAAFFLMAFFAYMFMRLYKISEEASLLSATLFAFTFYMTVKAPELADLHTILWMPAALYFVKKHAMQGRAYDLAFCAAALSLSFLGGHPQVFSYVYLLFAAYYFYEDHAAGNRGTAGGFIIINTALALAVAAQALPTGEFVMHSRRVSPGGMGFGASSGGFMRAEQLAEMLLPFLSAYVTKGNAFLNWMGLIDIGVLAMLLSALAAWKMEDRRRRLFLLSVFTAAFFISFMGSLPFYKFLFEKLVFLKLMRYPAKINIIFFFIMCVMAGYGFDILFSLDKDKWKGYRNFTLALAVAAAVSCLALAVFKAPILRLYQTKIEYGISLDKFVDAALTYDNFLQDLLIFTGALITACGLIYFVVEREIRSGAMRYGVLAAALACAIMYHWGGYRFYAPAQLFTGQSRTLDFLQKDPDMKNRRLLSPIAIGQFDREVNADRLEDLFYYQRDCLFPNLPMLHGIANADGFDSLILGDFFNLKTSLNILDFPWDHPDFSLLNVKYIASMAELKGKSIKQVFTGYTRVYEYAKPAGRAYFIPDSTGWRADSKSLRDFSGMKYPETSAVFLAGRAPAYAPEIGFKRKSINAFTVTLDVDRPGTLVISENNYPGWKASMDGKPAAVRTANVCFMSVELAAGRHDIEFKYEPMTFAAGMLISLLALIFAGVLPLAAYKRGG